MNLNINNSIKSTTLLSGISGALIVLLSAVIVFNLFISQWLTDKFDESLNSKLHLFQTLTIFDEDGLEFEFADEYMTEFSREFEPEYFQIWINNGIYFEKSRSLGDKNFEFRTTTLGYTTPLDITLPDGRDGRIVYVTFLPEFDDDLDELDDDDVEEENIIPKEEQTIPRVVIAIARERVSLDKMIFKANSTLIISFSIILLLLSLVIWSSIKRGIKPFDSLERQLETIDYKESGSYLRLTKQPIELDPIVERFNLLLDDVRNSIEREKKFSSDVAHELRTPIAEIRTLAEVALLGEPERSELVNVLGEVISVNQHMEKIVNQLLLLARNENSSSALELTTVNIKCIVDSLVGAFDDLINQRALIVELQLEPSLEIVAAQVEFKQIVTNLLSNAIEYSRQAGKVDVHWQAADSGFKLLVSNTTENLTQSDVDNMFKRLWRKDASRTGSAHIGVGLSLVKHYCKRLNYDISTSLSNDIFTIEISGQVSL